MAKSAIAPLHHQVYLTLRNELLSGHYGDTGPLPDEPSLALQFGVSRMTLRRALDRLQQEKLIVRKPRLGTFPLARERPFQIRSSIDAFYEALEAPAGITRQRVQSAGFVETPAFLRQRRVDFGEECLRVAKVSFARKEPMHYGIHFVPSTIARSGPVRARPRYGDLRWLHELGVKASRTDAVVSATAADTATAQLLKVDVGAPLLSTRRFAFDAKGRPIEYLEALSRPDLFSYGFQYSGDGPAGTRV